MNPQPARSRKPGTGKKLEPPSKSGRNRIKALVFDFDGLIVDTEVPIFRAWQRIYREHGQELPLDRWLTIIGTSSGSFDPVQELGDRVGEHLDEAALDTLERLYYAESTALQQLLPGVAEYLVDAHRLGLKTAVASSSSRKWVMEHLERFRIGGQFDAIVVREDVKNTKPDPELYRTALQRLGVQPDEAIALEDSTNGIHAAKAAGLYCVVVPNLLTADLDLTEADLRLLSLEAMSLPALLETVNATKPS